MVSRCGDAFDVDSSIFSFRFPLVSCRRVAFGPETAFVSLISL